MKKFLAFLISLILLSVNLAGIAESNDFSYDDLTDSVFSFSSGAGGWSTYLQIDAYGKFTAFYHDSEMGECDDSYPGGTVYWSSATGELGEPVQLKEYVWKLPIIFLTTDTEQTDEIIEDGIRYIKTDIPYGLENADYLLLYTPDMPIDELPEGFLMWTQNILENEDTDVLPFFGIYNETEECGFVEEERYADVKPLPVKTDVNSLPENGVLSCAVSEDAFHDLSLTLNISEPYRYDADALRSLQPGQIIWVPHEYVTIESVTEKEDLIEINGGFFNGTGTTFRLDSNNPQEANVLYDNDYLDRQKVGCAVLEYANTVFYHDEQFSDDEEIAEIPAAEFSDWLKARWDEEDGVYYDYWIVTVTVENNRISRIDVGMPEGM